MARAWWLLVWSLLLGGWLAACGREPPSGTPSSAPQRIVVSIPPLKDFVAWVAGPDVDIQVLVSAGQLPHDFEPRPSQMRALAQADLAVFNGRGLEPWAYDVVAALDLDARVLFVTEDDRFASSPYGENAHLWLDVTWAAVYVDVVRAALEARWPHQAEQWQQGWSRGRERLQALEAELRAQVASLPAQARRVAIVHAAWEPFLKPLGFDVYPLLEGAMFQEGGYDLPPQTLARWADVLRQQGVRVLVVEAQETPPALVTLAQDLGLPLVALDPLGGLPPRATYEAMMRENLAQLLEALQEP